MTSASTVSTSRRSAEAGQQLAAWAGNDAGEYVRVRHHVLTGLPLLEAIAQIKAAGFAHLILWSRGDVPSVRQRYRVAILADVHGRVAQVGAF